jgi:hypothetical protein
LHWKKPVSFSGALPAAASTSHVTKDHNVELHMTKPGFANANANLTKKPAASDMCMSATLMLIAQLDAQGHHDGACSAKPNL